MRLRNVKGCRGAIECGPIPITSSNSGSPSQPVIRMLATAHIECRDLPTADAVEALTKSIAAHGVLQPVLVRRHGARYTLIAGRKRLAAAIAANLGAVPCLLHEAEGASARRSERS